MVRRYLVGILFCKSLSLSAFNDSDSARYCLHANCLMAFKVLEECDSCLIIVAPELFDYSIIENKLERAVLELQFGYNYFDKITFGPLQMNYEFIRDYSSDTTIDLESLFSLNYQLKVLKEFITTDNFVPMHRYYFLSQKYNSGIYFYNDCYRHSKISRNREWTYYEFGVYLYRNILYNYCFYAARGTI